MSTSHDVAQLLREAAKAESLADQQRLVAEATNAQQRMRERAQQDRELDLAATAVQERFAPVAVFSHITAASDWLGEIDTSPDTAAVANQITAEATLWYGQVSPEVKADADEFAQHLAGRAQVVAGPFGTHHAMVFTSFLDVANELRSRDVRTGSIKEAASGLPQVGEAGNYSDESFATGNYDNALPLEATTSERAPQIQELEANNGSGASQDVTRPQSPPADQANGDAGTQENGSSMTDTQRSASRHTAYSGLPQVQQTVDPSDTGLQPTPLNPEVAFPWILSPNNVNESISQAEQQIAERDQRKGASKQAVAAAQAAYTKVMKEAGYDASGWIGDMGAGGYQPGVPPQGAGGHNLGVPDPVYGEGGDQGNRPGTGIGAEEREDFLNDPGDNIQPGDDLHADVGGRAMVTGARHAEDPQIKEALKFIAVRRAWLDKNPQV